MGESVYKVIELVGTSTESWEKAATAAVKAAVMVEDVARTVYFARQLGEPEIIPEDAVRKLRQRYTTEYGQ